METTIAGLKKTLQTGRILAVFEPRSNTMKLGTMRQALPASLLEADEVFCYTQGLSWNAQETLQPLGAKAHCHDSLPLLVADVVQHALPGDRILVMSNGGFGGVHAHLLDALSAKHGGTIG